MRPTTAPSLAFGEVIGQQRRPLCGRAIRRMAVNQGLRRRGRGIVPPSKALVVEALPQEDDVGDSVVDGEYEHCREDALEHGAEDVEDIAQQPGNDELDREAVGRFSSEVLYDLRGENYNPGNEGDGARLRQRAVSEQYDSKKYVFETIVESSSWRKQWVVLPAYA